MTANRTSTPSGGLADPATYRGDDGGHTERLLEHQDPPLLRGGADDVSVDAAGFLREPLQEQGGVQDLSLGLLQRLSLNSIGEGHRQGCEQGGEDSRHKTYGLWRNKQ